MTKSEKDITGVIQILEKFTRRYRPPLSEFADAQYKDPFKTLVATMLSARTKDYVTEKTVEKLFSKADNWRAIWNMPLGEIENLIKPVNFYRTKARHLKELARRIGKEFEGEVPKTLEELITLPGVGRKTANIVLAVAFKKDAIGVDTHVHRIMNQLGYVKTKVPQETEMELRMKLPKKLWKKINYNLVLFGQNICTPISPFCSRCPVRNFCRRVGVKKSR